MNSTFASLNPGSTARAQGVEENGLRTAQTVDLAVAANAQDLVAANGDGFRRAARGVRRIHLGVEDNEVHRTVAIVALRADDEPCDQGCGDDPDNDVGSEAGGHACFPGWAVIRPALGLERAF